MITWDMGIMYTDLFHQSITTRFYYFLACDFYEERLADEQMLELIEY